MIRGKYKRTKETLRKLSISHTGKKLSQETKNKIRNSMKGDKTHLWKGGLTTDRNKYMRDRYNNLSTEEKKHISWERNKRNRVIKRLKVDGLFHTYGEWELLKKQYGYACPCCNKQEPEIKLTEDHIIPLSKGGSDLIENIQPLCLKCNMKKHTNTIKY